MMRTFQNLFKNWYEITLTLLGIAITLTAYIFFGLNFCVLLREKYRLGFWWGIMEQILFFTLISLLVYGAFVYLFTRMGYLFRLRRHQPAAEQELDYTFAEAAPSLTILVPSYKEDSHVVEQALISAALQNYPDKRIVLLIDDPPQAKTESDRQLLKQVRALPQKLHDMMAPFANKFAVELELYCKRRSDGVISWQEELRNLADLSNLAAKWYSDQLVNFEQNSHTDRFFAKQILEKPLAALRQKAKEFQRQVSERRPVSEEWLLRQYRRLASIFRCQISSFERKNFANLSHEANKAMNLNSYIGLMGKHLAIDKQAEGDIILEVEQEQADFFIPDADYIITLDADSLLLADYAERLIHLGEQQSHRRIAVFQTPYSAVPDASCSIERVAGATTDIQYQIHQGFTAFNSTYWVGANALLRKKALEEIASTDIENGYPVVRYIQDRTVIEDTESSIDLAAKGWQLFNYPERLAFSATPPDFGSLIIQRRRWANGGLIILPKLLCYLFSGPVHFSKILEGIFRFHYLFSITAVNFGLLILLAYPFADSIRSLWLPLTALPYFFFYSRDLFRFSYRQTDLFQVYALNLLLIPINIGGVLKSLQQAFTGKKIPFGRTPKVKNRTAAPSLYIAVTFLLIMNWLMAAGFDIASRYWIHALYALLNASFMLYAILAFVGLKECWIDLRHGLRAPLVLVNRVRALKSIRIGRLVFLNPMKMNK